MELKDVKNGQIVRHILGYKAKVVNVTVNGNVHVKSLESGKYGSQVLTVGSSSIVEAHHLLLLNTYGDLSYTETKQGELNKVSDFKEMNKTIEGLTGLLKLAGEVDKKQQEKPASTFKCELGSDIKFEGTHEDFNLFLAGVGTLMNAGNAAQKRMK